ncbi:hypothetical protein TI03_04850 [Achromatium sp. WMS1]|nr:hypothetical protein TI03_04850 [Achromatium sp. WMS1]
MNKTIIEETNEQVIKLNEAVSYLIDDLDNSKLTKLWLSGDIKRKIDSYQVEELFMVVRKFVELGMSSLKNKSFSQVLELAFDSVRYYFNHRRSRVFDIENMLKKKLGEVPQCILDFVADYDKIFYYSGKPDIINLERILQEQLALLDALYRT